MHRVWKAPGFADLNLDQVKEEVIELLARANQESIFNLIKEVIKDLEGLPSLMSIQNFLNRLSEAGALLTPLNEILLKIKLYLAAWSIAYSAREIQNSQAFACITRQARSEAAAEELNGQGAYLCSPCPERIEAALSAYTRDNRPSLKLYDETSDPPTVALERNAKETKTPSKAIFKAKILGFCDNNVSMANFICANLGPEPLALIRNENANSLHVSKSYLPFFPLDEFTLAWYKLKDAEGQTYYQHHLHAVCYHLKTSIGEKFGLTDCSLGGTLRKIAEEDYDSLCTSGKLTPLVSTIAVVELRLLEGIPQTPRVVRYTTCLACSEIKYEASPVFANPEESLHSAAPRPLCLP